MNRLQPYLLPTTIFLMGVVFTLLGLHAQNRRQELAASGVSVPGHIVFGKINSGSKGKNKYYLRVSWTNGTAAREDFFQVKQEFFAQHVAGTSYREQENRVTAPDVEVRTLPGRPEAAILPGGSTDNFGMQYLGFGLLALGGFLVFRAWRQTREVHAPAV